MVCFSNTTTKQQQQQQRPDRQSVSPSVSQSVSQSVRQADTGSSGRRAEAAAVAAAGTCVLLPVVSKGSR